MIRMLIIVLCLSIGSIFAEDAPATPKKYTLAVGAIFKNEAPWFKEWIEYHQIVGVEHFYLYNNGSTDNYLEVLDPYVKSGVVTIIDWPNRNQETWGNEPFMWVKTTQVSAYEDAMKVRALNETKWLALIDIDEFMVPVKLNTMTAVLENHKDSPGISLLWHLMGRQTYRRSPKIHFSLRSCIRLPKQTLPTTISVGRSS